MCFLDSSPGALVWDIHYIFITIFKKQPRQAFIYEDPSDKKEKSPRKGCVWTLSSAFSHAHHSQDAEFSIIFSLMLPTQALQCVTCTYPWVWGAVPSKGRGEERSGGDPLSPGPFPTRLTGPILGFSAPTSASLSPPLAPRSPSSPLSPSLPLLSPPLLPPAPDSAAVLNRQKTVLVCFFSKIFLSSFAFP